MFNLIQTPTEAEIRQFLRHTLFGKNIFCPKCQGRKKVISRCNRYFCSRCRIYFSLLSHTWLAHLRIPLLQLWSILWCWTKQIPVKQAQELTHLSEKGVRHFYDLFRGHLPKDQESLDHIVQLDEAYFGGMLGFALLMGKQKGTRKLAYRILPNNQPNRSDAYRFIQEWNSTPGVECGVECGLGRGWGKYHKFGGGFTP